MRTLGGLSSLTWTNPRPKKKGGVGGEGDQNANANEIDLILHHLISKERELEEIKFSSSFPPDPLPHTLCPSQK